MFMKDNEFRGTELDAILNMINLGNNNNGVLYNK